LGSGFEAGKAMNIHEYQAKQMFGDYGIPVPRGFVAKSALEAFELAGELVRDGVERFVVKAQVHAGGRGKAGGIRLCSSPQEVERVAAELIGHTLVTHQTGADGKPVGSVLVEEVTDIAKEFYVGLVIDRSRYAPALIACAEGGVEIEEVAKRSPEKVLTFVLWPYGGVDGFVVRSVARAFGLDRSQSRELARLLNALYRTFREKECTLAEINPLVLKADGHLLALDAKLNFDDNALYRHPELRLLRDPNQEDALEVQARRFGVDYVRMDGEIGCMVNGAGLAMATMDLVDGVGLSPANFLDIKGGARKENVVNAFKLLSQDERVKVAFINIFGGIVRCDMVAQGLVEALDEVDVKVPMVIRLVGTNEKDGRRILEESGRRFVVVTTLSEAKQAVLSAVRGGA